MGEGNEDEHAKMMDAIDKENLSQSLAESLLNSDVLSNIVHQITKNLTKNRKARIKFLIRVYEYLKNIYGMFQNDNSIVVRLIDNLDDFQRVIVETLKLCNSLSQPLSMISQIYYMIQDIGVYLETFVGSIYKYCHTNEKSFGKIVMNLLESFINASCENPNHWLYSVAVSTAVLDTVNIVYNTDEFIEMSIRCEDLFLKIPAAVFGCGDFSCQYYLMIVFLTWIHTIRPTKALRVIKSGFPYLDHDSRKLLLEKENIELVVRKFLNAVNFSTRGPQNIIPIRCLYLFISNTSMNPPKIGDSSNDFWMDFSVESERLHAFYENPNSPNSDFSSLSIRKDQIDSICLNWVVNYTAESPNIKSQGITQSSILNNEKVMFLHLDLNVDVDTIVPLDNLNHRKNKRSIYFVFRDEEYVVKVMQEMKFHQHQCGSNSCKRPKALLNLLATEHNLKYKASWCSTSQVFGIDESITFEDCSQEATLSSDEQTEPNINETQNSSLLRTPTSEINTSSGSELPSFGVGTPAVSFCKDSPVPNSSNTPSNSLKTPRRKKRQGTPRNKTPNRKSTPGYRDCQNESLSTQESSTRRTLFRTPTRFERQRKILQPLSPTPGAHFCASIQDDGVQDSRKHTFELPSGVYVSETSADIDSDGSIDNPDKSLLHNLSSATNETNFEDPLPRTSREKYTRLYMHAPFHSSTPKPNIQLNEDDMIKLAIAYDDSVSDDKPIIGNQNTSVIESPPSSPVSPISIVSPKENRLNLTASTSKLYETIRYLETQDKTTVTQPVEILHEGFNSIGEEVEPVSPSPDFIPSSLDLIKESVNVDTITSKSISDECKSANEDVRSKNVDPVDEMHNLSVPASDSVDDDNASLSPPLSPVFGYSRAPVIEDIQKSPRKSPVVICSPLVQVVKEVPHLMPQNLKEKPIVQPIKKQVEQSNSICGDKYVSSSSESTPEIQLKVPTIVATSSKRNAKKLPWANASTEYAKQKQKRYDEDPNYDPYDILGSTQFENYKQKLFPQPKTYARKRKLPNQTKVLVKKKRIGVVFEDEGDNDFPPPPKNKRSKTHNRGKLKKTEKAQTSLLPTKYKSFFNSRQR